MQELRSDRKMMQPESKIVQQENSLKPQPPPSFLNRIGTMIGLMNASKFAAPKDFGRNDTDSRLGSASSE